MLKKNTFKIAIPSKGRLMDNSISILKEAGLRFRTPKRALFATCNHTGAVIVFAHAIDVPVLVSEGFVDLGVTGRDLVEERKANVRLHSELGFGKCRLCVAVHAHKNIKTIKKLNGKTIGTKFMQIAKRFFKAHKIKVHLVKIEGATEGMVPLGLVDGIVELVESGDSLQANNLVAIHEIGSYQAVLIGSKDGKKNVLRETLLRRIEGVMLARQFSMLEYNVHRRQLKKATVITPGFNSPTIQTLADPDWLAVKVMVPKKEVQDVMDRLEKLGAHAIFETVVKHCRL